MKDWIELKVSDGSAMKAYTAMPPRPDKAPGVIVFQEIFGVSDHIKEVVRRFASEGFIAAAPDLFHRTAPGFQCPYTEPQAGAPHAQALTFEGLKADAEAVFDWFSSDGKADSEMICAAGFCLGGRAAFLANTVLPLKAAVSFYGGKIGPELLARVKHVQGPLLMIWGGLDKHIPPEQIASITAALRGAEKPFVNVEFSNAGHGFFCDARPSYHADCADQAWAMTLRFLRQQIFPAR